MKIRSICSGSEGNAILAWEDDEAVLVDAGASARRLEQAVRSAGLEMDQVRGILLTHEHTDHVSGLAVLSRRRKLPLFATSGTEGCLAARLGPGADVRRVRAGREFSAGRFHVKPFSVSHDAAEPVGYVLRSGDARAAVATDLGHMDDGVRGAVAGCDALYIESNHDVDMLLNGPYPWPLKERILGRHGHLSNRACAESLASVVGERTRHLVLSHLSRTNNTPRAAYEESRKALEASGLPVGMLEVAPRKDLGTTFDI